MRIGRCLVGAVLAAGLASLAPADEPRKPGATGVFLPGDGRDLSFAVLTEKRLQEELKVTPEQLEKLKPLAETYAAAQKAWKADQNDRTKSKAAGGAFRKAQGETHKALAAVLTAEQGRRLTQVERQVAGVGAFLDDASTKDLKLTEEQREKVVVILQKRLRGVLEAPRDDKGVLDAKLLRQFDQDAMTAIQEVLTDEQKKTWKELNGAPFDTTGFAFSPPGGGR
jgi:hypothetical protein